MKKIIFVCFLFLFSSLHLSAQEKTAEQKQAELNQVIEIQKIIKADYLRLLTKIQDTVNSLNDPNGADKENYEILKYVLKLMAELQVEKDMQELQDMIKGGTYNRALTKTNLIGEKIAKILSIFDNGIPYEENPQIPSLKEQITQLNNLLSDLKALKTETQQAAQAKELLKLTPEELKNTFKDLTEQQLKDLIEKAQKDAQNFPFLKEKQDKLNQKIENLKLQLQDKKAKENIDNAEKDLKDSSQKLEQEEPKQANQLQQEAEKELEKAKEELEKQLKKYQDLQNEKLLVHMQQEIQKLRETQAKINKTTLDLRVKLEPSTLSKYRRELILLKKDQKIQRDTVTGLVAKLQEGNVPIFAQVLENIGKDIDKVVGEMSQNNLDEYVTELQEDILKSFDDLLDSLKKERKRRENQNSPPPQQNNKQGKQEPRLIPLPAELELLLKHQEYVRLKYQQILNKYPDLKARNQMTPAQRRIFERLSQAQGENSRYLEELRKTLFPKQ